MPPQASRSNSTPPLPPGYALDSPATSAPPLPAGYTLDSAAGDQQQPKRGVLSGMFHNLVDPRDPMSAPGAKRPGKEQPAPGSFEGHPENIGEYVPASAGEIAGGVKDIYQGNVAKGGRRVISGAAAAAAPAAALVGLTPANIGTTFRGVAGAAAGTTATHAVAKGLGASEDQAGLAGDVAGVVTGGLSGAARPGTRIRDSISTIAEPAIEAGKSAAEDIPVLGPGIKALSKYRNVPGKLAEIWKGEEPAPPPTPAAPSTATAKLSASSPAIPADAAAVGNLKSGRGTSAKTFQADTTTNPGAPLPRKPSWQNSQAEPTELTVDTTPAEPWKPTRAPKQAAPAPKDRPTPAWQQPGQSEGRELTVDASPMEPYKPTRAPAPPVRGSVAKSMAAPDEPTQIARGSVAQMMNSAKKTSPSQVEGLLQQGLGNKPLDPNVPLKMQGKAADLPEGHTPVESSALRSYKYDPTAKEFHARATSGDTTYVYGDVSPEAAQGFEQAESKGKAWQGIRSNPLVAKIVNGKRIDVKPARGSISASFGQNAP